MGKRRRRKRERERERVWASEAEYIYRMLKVSILSPAVGGNSRSPDASEAVPK